MMMMMAVILMAMMLPVILLMMMEDLEANFTKALRRSSQRKRGKEEVHGYTPNIRIRGTVAWIELRTSPRSSRG